jgi:hypothetical protein
MHRAESHVGTAVPTTYVIDTSLAPGLLSRPTTRFIALASLPLIYYLAFEFTQWRFKPGQLSEPVSILPIPAVAWYTGAFLLLGLAFWMILAVPARLALGGSDLGMRRAAVLLVALAFGVEIATRMAVGFFGLESRLGPTALLGGAGCAVVGLAIALRPPRTTVLAGLMLGAGLLARVAWILVVSPDPGHVDNMFVIQRGLERFVAGQTPYAYFDFGSHQNPMPYLPWTFLSYLPAFMLRLDLLMTNIILSLAVIGVLGALAWRLPSAAPERSMLILTVALFYLLPVCISLDVQTEFQWYNLMLVLTYVLLLLGRLRSAAAAFGLALGAMPVALYAAPLLLVYALKTLPVREVARLGAIVFVVAGAPIALFLLWDAGAFTWAVSYVPRENYAGVESTLNVASYEWPIRALWHVVAGRGLVFVQIGCLAAFAWLAVARLQTVRGLIALTAGCYLVLTLSSLYIGPHLPQVAIYLGILGEVTRALHVAERGAEPIPALAVRG